MGGKRLLRLTMGLLLVALLSGCGAGQATPAPAVTAETSAPTATAVSPTIAPAPSPTVPAGASIVGQVARIDEMLKPAIVIPCLVVSDQECRMQGGATGLVTDAGSFEIVDVAPGTYAFFYGPAAAIESRSAWEDKLVRLENAMTIAASFDPSIVPVGCRDLEQGKPVGGLVEIGIVMDRVWLEPIALQIDFPGGIGWGALGPWGPEQSTPLQVEVKAGQTASVALGGLGCATDMLRPKPVAPPITSPTSQPPASV
jgi:hypothetical protein